MNRLILTFARLNKNGRLHYKTARIFLRPVNYECHQSGKIASGGFTGFSFLKNSCSVSTLPNLRGINFTTTIRSTDEISLFHINKSFENLKSDQVKIGYLNFEYFTKFLNNAISNESFLHKLADNQINFILECFVNYLPTQSNSELKLELFYKLWNHLNGQNLLTKMHILTALKFLRKNGCSLNEYENFIEKYKKSIPNLEENDLELYESRLWVNCEHGNIEKANGILEELRSKNYPLTENIFDALIFGYSRNHDEGGINMTLDSMNAANIPRSPNTYFQLIQAYLEINDVGKAEKLLKEQGNNLNVIHITEIAKTAAKKSHQDIIKESIKYLPLDLIYSRELAPTFRNVCTEFVHSNELEKAFMLIESFPKPLFNENNDSDTFGRFFIYEMFKIRTVSSSKILEFCAKLVDLQYNTRAFHIACELSFRLRPDESLEYLHALGKKESLRPHYFWPLLIHYYKIGGEMKLLQVVEEMLKLKVDFDFDTLSIYVLPKLSLVLEDSVKGIKMLENCGLNSSQFLTPLLVHLIVNKRLTEADFIASSYQARIDTEKLLHPLVDLLQNVGSTGRFEPFAKFVKNVTEKSINRKEDFPGIILLEAITNLRTKNNPSVISKVLKTFAERKIKISSTTGDILGSFLDSAKHGGSTDRQNTEDLSEKQKALTSNLSTVPRNMINNALDSPLVDFSGSNFNHPRDMSLEELECHLIELEAKGMNARGILRRLLQMCIREGKLERALEVKKKCDQLKVHVSPGMLASIFDMYTRLKLQEEARNTLNQLRRSFPDFELDEHKLIDFAALLVENQHYEDAKKILAERAKSTKILGGENSTKNIWRLLNNVAGNFSLSTTTNRTKEFFQFLQDLGYCSIHNALLGPVIREYLSKNQIREAVREYEEFVEKYRKTPLQFELMSVLIDLSNHEEAATKCGLKENEAREFLQKVITLSGRIHGNQNANTTFILALANSGTENQLRKTLINPEIRINADALIKNCEHLTNVGRMEILLKLAKSCRGMGHAIKEDMIYELLLNNFKKENNCAAALELYEKLEADDEFKMSQSFIKSTVNLFKMNNFRIPSNLAIRAGDVS